MSRRLLSLACAAAVLGALALPGHALPTTKPQVTDPAGDSLGGQGDIDILSVLYTTSGAGSGKAYVPKKLVVTLTLGAAPPPVPGVSYKVGAGTNTCGNVNFIAQFGTAYEAVVHVNAWAEWGSCMSKSDPTSNLELIVASVKGSQIIWTFGLKSTPLKIGSVFSEFAVTVDPCDPVLCLPPNSYGADLGLFDAATGTGTWKLG